MQMTQFGNDPDGSMVTLQYKRTVDLINIIDDIFDIEQWSVHHIL